MTFLELGFFGDLGPLSLPLASFFFSFCAKNSTCAQHSNLSQKLSSLLTGGIHKNSAPNQLFTDCRYVCRAAPFSFTINNNQHQNLWPKTKAGALHTLQWKRMMSPTVDIGIKSCYSCWYPWYISEKIHLKLQNFFATFSGQTDSELFLPIFGSNWGRYFMQRFHAVSD